MSYGEVQSQEFQRGGGREKYCTKVSNSFAALEDLDAEVENAWETISTNITFSAKERLGSCKLRKSKPWFDK
jgi:hypothetical protein